MSLTLATKGRIGGALPNATRGVLYLYPFEIEAVVLTIIPELIFRRVLVNKIFRKEEVDTIFRREDVYSNN